MLEPVHACTGSYCPSFPKKKTCQELGVIQGDVEALCTEDLSRTFNTATDLQQGGYLGAALSPLFLAQQNST